ncbi:histidine kinase [Leucobacter allii]|uniref:sensor histidine kinase n=1 Tax=Leucobacter allii TaxID=2932247 RepID=UPI001FD3D0A2|nr:histidine kinase [Leucobacter allii]UOR03282.1 histidine kinase [Leucobacter allii]
MTETPVLRIDDLRGPPPRPLAWLRRHPVVIDVAVVLFACTPLAAALVLRAYDFGWWGWPLLGLTAGALLLRRRQPMAVLVVVALACAWSPLAQPGTGFPTIPTAFALYTVASRQSTVRALIGYGVGVAATVLATVPHSLAGEQPPRVALLDSFALIALVAGLIVRNRRDQQQRLLELVNERIEHAGLAERTRIAAEMHDVVAHALTMIVSLANGAASIRAKHPAKADAAVDRIAAVGREALAEMHRTLGLLRGADAGLDERLHRSGGNLPELEELVESVRATGITVSLTREGDQLPEDVALRQAVFRIVQESLTNTLRHAVSPSSVEVVVIHEHGRIEIRVEDDGGAAAAVHIPGNGLVGIQQRARAFGGTAESGPRPGGGWRTSAVLNAHRERRAEVHDG